MSGSAHPEVVTESNSAPPRSARPRGARLATEPITDQPVCDRQGAEGPHSAPDAAVTRSNWGWWLAEWLLDRLDAWENPRPTRGELMDYARTGPYTLPVTYTKDAKGVSNRHITLLRRLGILYARVISTNVHTLLYSALWLLRRPSRALAKTPRPTLGEIYDAARTSSGPAQWVNLGLLATHTAAYAVSWVIERPSRAAVASSAFALFRGVIGL